MNNSSVKTSPVPWYRPQHALNDTEWSRNITLRVLFTVQILGPWAGLRQSAELMCLPNPRYISRAPPRPGVQILLKGTHRCKRNSPTLNYSAGQRKNTHFRFASHKMTVQNQRMLAIQETLSVVLYPKMKYKRHNAVGPALLPCRLAFFISYDLPEGFRASPS